MPALANDLDIPWGGHPDTVARGSKRPAVSPSPVLLGSNLGSPSVQQRPAVLVIQTALLLLLVGSWAYCVLTVVAALRYRKTRPAPLENGPPISVLKPLWGAEDALEINLRSFFTQRYSTFEILFAVRDAADPALIAVEKLRAEFPDQPCRVVITGEPPYANAKVFSIVQMIDAARYDLLVMSDSDIRVTPDMLATLAAEFDSGEIDLLTCPYRAVPGPSPWSTLEAVGLNTEFLSGLLVARLVEGVKFAVGPTIAARKSLIEGLGGFGRFREYLAEDFALGKLAAESGYGVDLSSYVIEHHIGSQGFGQNFRHRLRWARSTRRSRPSGYAGQVFTCPLALAILVSPLVPGWPAILALTALFRAPAAWAVAGHVLHDPLTRSRWWLIPVQDILGFLIWAAGFFGNQIQWRDRTYRLLSDGRFQRVP